VVWYDPISRNAFWGTVNDGNAGCFSVARVFDRFAGRQIARAVVNWNPSYPEFLDPRTPPLALKLIKDRAFKFYNECRAQPCISAAFGEVWFTLRGWRHITAQNRERSKIIRSIELLGAAKAILAKQEHFHVCRVTSKGHMLFKQTAKIKHQSRADAIVSVITEKIGNGPHQFLSVYEHGEKKVGGR